MATLRKQKKSDFYYVRFQHKGKDYWRSTGKKTKKEAEERAKEIIAEVREEASVQDRLTEALAEVEVFSHSDSDDTALSHATIDTCFRSIVALLNQLPPAQRDRIRLELGSKLQRGSEAKLTVAEAWGKWLDSPKKRRPGERTIQGYETQWKRFLHWLETREVKFLHEVTPVVAEDYARDLQRAHYAPGTYNSHLTFLRGMFKVLLRTAGMTVNPWEGLPLLELERQSRRQLTAKELKTVFSRAQGDLRYMIGIGLYTGLRLKDVATLKWSSWEEDQHMLSVKPAKTARKNKIVRIPLHPVAEALLRELRAKAKGEYVLPVTAKDYERDNSIVSSRIQKFFESCGIATKEEAPEGSRQKAITRVGFHSLRHSFVSLCAANRVPQVAVMELVGHGSPAMTALYSHAGDEQKAKAIAALPSISFDHRKVTDKPKRRKRKSEGAQ